MRGEQSSTGGLIWSWGCGGNTQSRVLGLLVQACEQWGQVELPGWKGRARGEALHSGTSELPEVRALLEVKEEEQKGLRRHHGPLSSLLLPPCIW